MPVIRPRWPLTQHAPAFEETTLFNLLSCAAAFEGENARECAGELNELLAKTGVLTTNVRDGVNSAWRDYQQVLAEIGLMYSSEVSPWIRITTMGRMYLAGDFDYQQVLTTQVMRYQYPNGQKTHPGSDDESGLRGTHYLHGQIAAGIMIRPAALALRVLLGLQEDGHVATLTTDEVALHLVPCHSNEDWQSAVAQIVNSRTSGSTRAAISDATRRNCQDWMKLLARTPYFDLEKVDRQRALTLSDFVYDDLGGAQQYAETLADKSTFWEPNGSDLDEIRSDWFDFFGSPEIELEANTPVTNSLQAGDEGEKNSDQTGPTVINLRPFAPRAIQAPTPDRELVDNETLLEAILNGQAKRLAQTALHENIVAILAEKCLALGAEVFEDQNSVDLLAIWGDGTETIFEVKTVTNKSLASRVRLAIGQLEEYAFRRILDGHIEPEKVVVLSATLNHEHFYADLVTKRMGFGLIGITPTHIAGLASSNKPQTQIWSVFGTESKR